MKVALINREDLTGKERRAWDEARTALLYEAPMWSHLWYTMMVGQDNEQALFSREIKGVAATDDKRIWINPEKFAERPLGERVFILGHEITHAMFGHQTLANALNKAGKVTYSDGKGYAYNDEVMQHAMDYYVNDVLFQGEIGVMPADASHNPKYHANMKLLDIYRSLMDEQPDQPPPPPEAGAGGDDPDGDGDNKPNPNGGFDQHATPGSSDGTTPDQAAMERDDEEWKTEIRAAADNAKAQGKLPGFIEEMLKDALGSDTDWRDRMRTLLARGVGTGSFSWQHPDRRLITREDMIIAPGRRGFKCKLVVLVGDSSGSINEPTASAFFAEMDKIIDELEPEEMMFAWCDAKVHGWSSVDSYDGIRLIRKAGIKGRLGTNFRPPFEDIAKMGLQPDALIYLSDLYGPFPNEPPPYQVIWGRVHSQVQPPFGDVVDIPVKEV